MPSIPTAKPSTSSITKEASKYPHLGINELFNKLRSTTEFSRHSNDRNPENSLVDNESVDLDQTTNGPYDNARVELHDDPAAMVDHRVKEDDGYMSTIEPETVTTFSDSYNSYNH